MQGGDASLGYLAELFKQLSVTPQRWPVLEMHMGAFSLAAAIDELKEEGVKHKIKVPFGAGRDSENGSPDAGTGTVWTSLRIISISGLQ